jgi:hypothetical protein
MWTSNAKRLLRIHFTREKQKHMKSFPCLSSQSSWICLPFLLAALGISFSKHRSSAEDGGRYERIIQPLLAKHCLACHGENAKAQRLRLDRLTSEFAGNQGEHWAAVLEKVRSDDMPPKGKSRPMEAEKKLLVEWIQAGLHTAAEASQQGEGRVTLRRLNRNEYQNTIRDLLGVDIDVKGLLPEDSTADGFDTSARALSISPVLMERYLEAASTVLDAAVTHPSRSATRKIRSTKVGYDGRKDVQIINSSYLYPVVTDARVFFMDYWSKLNGQRTFPAMPPDFPQPLKVRGRYRFTISGYGFQTARPVTMAIYTIRAKPGGGDIEEPVPARLFDFKPGEPQRVEFTLRLDAGQLIGLGSQGLGSEVISHFIKTKKFPTVDEYKGPGLAVQWIEMEGPLVDPWPTETHRRLFDSLQLTEEDKQSSRPNAKTATAEVVAVAKSSMPEVDTERLLRQFAFRAFRHPPTEEELRPALAVIRSHLKQGYSFQDALFLGYKVVLCSPSFLYLRESPGKLDDYALASRLSYFLWSSMPDQELLELAGKRKLGDSAILRQQTERLLRDPKAAAFTENFVGQWLGLRQLEATLPDEQLYPEFDTLLQYSMPKETVAFFDELLRNDLSVANFIDSDFVMLNERLARHYGISGVEGIDIRKVPLPPGNERGGVLAQASILRLTANGTTTSPVVRGAWVLRNIIGRPPSPPPADVPAVEPDLKGATTIRELLDKHRVPGCAQCHEKIDPLGFALEGFDVIGGRRDVYRVMPGPGSKGSRVNLEVGGLPVRYLEGPPVDAAGTLPGGRKYTNFTEFKRLLLEDKDQIAHCLTEKLLTYGTGRGIRANDKAAVEAIVARVRDKGYGLRSMIHEVVQSPIFLHK